MESIKRIIIIFSFISVVFFMQVFADTPEELIQRFEELPKEEQQKLKDKTTFFKDKFLEQFRDLTEGQQNILIDKYKIDLNAVEAILSEVEKRIKDELQDEEDEENDGVKKNVKSKKTESLSGAEKQNVKSNKSKKSEDDEEAFDNVKEPTKKISEIDRLNEQFKSERDPRKILSKVAEQEEKDAKTKSANKQDLDITEDDSNRFSNIKDNKRNLNNSKTSKHNEAQEDDFDGDNKKLEISRGKEKPKSNNEKERRLEKQNLIDDKIQSALDQIKIENEIEPYGYDLFAKKNEMTSSKIQTSGLLQDDYVLGPGDELVINLYGSKSNKYTLEILKEGVIHIPSIGPVEMSGLTYKEAKLKISKLIQEKMLNTEVFVTTGKIRSINVFLMGEFIKPGVIKVPSNATLMDALFLSGGIKEIGSLREIQIKRNSETVSTIDLYDFLQRGNSKEGLSLKNGDIVFCPVVGSTVTVMGEVQRPAKYELKIEKTIKEVLQTAGSVTPRAYLKNVKVERSLNNLKRKIIDLDLSTSESLGWNFEIITGDIVIVSSLVYERSNSVFLAGNIKRPGVYSWVEGMKVSDIIKSTEDLLPQTEFSYAVIERNSGQKKQSVLISFSLEEILINKKHDVALMANDKIVIYHVRDFREQPVVKVDGQIVHPGFYSFYEGMKVSDIILAGGGLREDAYKDRADLYRWVEEKSVFEMISINLKDEEALKYSLQKRDRLTIYSMWDVVQKDMVEVVGFVNKPGKYLYFDGMKVSDLIFASGSLKDYADRRFANIHRKTIDDAGQMVLKFLSVDLAGIFNGNKEADIELMPKDKLEVLEISKFIQDAKVTIMGEIKLPGSYQWGEGMRISDVIRTAGGLDKSAYLKNAELTHYEIINGEQRFVAHENINLEAVLAGNKTEDKILKAYDEINILKIPGWSRVATVELKGEVLYPGVYTIERGEKISDLIKRAGGLTENAYVFATFFSREKVRISQKEQMDNRASELEKRMLNIKDSQSEGEVGKATATKENIRELVNRIRNTKVTGRVSLNMELALKNNESADNLVLEGNDIIVIPRKSDVVYIIGEVRNETTFILNKDLSAKDYIKKAGGFTAFADTKSVYIVRADGSVANFKSSGFKGSILSSTGHSTKGLLAGDTIVIPEKLDRYEGMKLAKDISQIFSQMALSIAAFASIGVL